MAQTYVGVLETHITNIRKDGIRSSDKRQYKIIVAFRMGYIGFDSKQVGYTENNTTKNDKQVEYLKAA